MDLEKRIRDLSIKSAAHCKMIDFFHEMSGLGYECSDKYIASRIEELSRTNTRLQVERLGLLADAAALKSESCSDRVDP